MQTDCLICFWIYTLDYSWPKRRWSVINFVSLMICQLSGKITILNIIFLWQKNVASPKT